MSKYLFRQSIISSLLRRDDKLNRRDDKKIFGMKKTCQNDNPLKQSVKLLFKNR